MAYLWGDLYKPVKDFFSKEYNTVPLRLEVAVPAKDEEWIAPTVERLNDGSFNITAELGQKFGWGNYPSQGKVTVTGAGRVKVEGKTKHSGQHVGAELNGLADLGPVDCANDKYEVTLDLRRYKGAGSVIGRFPKNRPIELEASFCTLFKKQYLVGAQGIFNTNLVFNSLVLGLSHRAPGRVLAATFDKNFTTKLGVILAAKDSPYNVCPDGTCPIVPRVQSEYGFEFAVGKSTNLTAGIKSTVVDGADKIEYRGKVSNTGNVGLSVKRRLTPNVTGTFSTDIDLKSAKGTYGLKLVWG